MTDRKSPRLGEFDYNRNGAYFVTFCTGNRAEILSHQKIMRNLKAYTTHIYGDKLWQRSYYDHIIRAREDYEAAWNYIDGNPQKWLDGKGEDY